MSLKELLIAHQASTQIRIGCTWSVLSILQKLSGLPSQPEQLPCGSITLATHPLVRTSSRSASQQHPNSNQPTSPEWEQHLVSKSLLRGQQLKPEQCNECSGCQCQSKPIACEGANHVAPAVAPINRAISQTQAATGLLWPSHNSRPSRMEEGLQHKESRLHSNIMHTA